MQYPYKRCDFLYVQCLIKKQGFSVLIPSKTLNTNAFATIEVEKRAIQRDLLGSPLCLQTTMFLTSIQPRMCDSASMWPFLMAYIYSTEYRSSMMLLIVLHFDLLGI